MGDDDLVFAKGIYRYSYMTSRDKFDERQLPPIEAFYGRLNDEPLDNKDYERAQKTWTHFNMQTLRDYHDHWCLATSRRDWKLSQHHNGRTSVGLSTLFHIALPSMGICNEIYGCHARSYNRSRRLSTYREPHAWWHGDDIAPSCRGQQPIGGGIRSEEANQLHHLSWCK